MASFIRLKNNQLDITFKYIPSGRPFNKKQKNI